MCHKIFRCNIMHIDEEIGKEEKEEVVDEAVEEAEERSLIKMNGSQ